MNILKKLAGQTAIYGLSSIVGRLLNYLLVPLYTRIFLTEEYGIVVELYTYTAFFLVILTYGMETSFFRFATKKNLNKVYQTSNFVILTTTSIFLFLSIFFSRKIANFLNYNENHEYIIFFICIISIDVFTSITFAKLRYENKAIKFALIKSTNIAMSIFLNIFFLILCPKILENNNDSFIKYFYFGNLGVAYIFISNLIASIFTLLLLAPEIFKNFIFKVFNKKNEIDFKLLKKILIYSSPLLIAGTAGTINEMMDRILLKNLLEENIMSAIGIYGANYKLAILMTLFIQTFRFAAEPFFFSEAKNKNSKKLYSEVMTYFIIFGLFIFLLINLYIDFFQNFIGEEFREGIKIVPILLMANLFLGIYFNLSIWYKLNDLTKFGAYLSIFGAIITIIFNFILIPKISYLGSAYATLICYFLMMISSYFLGQKYFPIKYDLKKIFVLFTITLILFFLNQIFISDIKNEILKLFFNSSLLMIYISIIYFFIFKKLIAKF